MDEKGNRKIVTHYHTDDSHRTLGVMITPNGKKIQHIERTRKVFSQFGDRIRVGYINIHDVLLSLQSIVMRTLSYPHPPITISEYKYKKLWHQY